MTDWIERNRGHILVTLINLAALGAVVFWVCLPPRSQVQMSVPVLSPTPMIQLTNTPSSMRVYVSGAVQYPDVYTLEDGSLVVDALEASGGPLDDADLNHVNLARVLHDQEQVYVPFEGEIEGLPQPQLSDRSYVLDIDVGSEVVDINSATAQELEVLPGIGPGLAERIVAYRDSHGVFRAPEEIMEVSGIGEATYERIKTQIVAE
jgi:competence protein ComEA